ncbi:hypothetical protein F5876DRAFT_61167 [Lentinula aff. lateritia]|uniref:Uncharacterized protein n=1 Tax=Lentinula aff. lateritia TaxID=2804960 RepID=A0ACC1UGC4_9AGAR|nr:hypothetical protein F5876DRAFT_61167 [Lentinula aff. lateritia]
MTRTPRRASPFIRQLYIFGGQDRTRTKDLDPEGMFHLDPMKSTKKTIRGHKLREQAAKKYRLELKDLDVIDPIERQFNPRGPAPIRKYNEQDVAVLSRRLFTAAKRVGDILALTRAQLNTIPPVSVEPNPYSPNSAPMRYYNALRFDMQKLKYDIQG